MSISSLVIPRGVQFERKRDYDEQIKEFADIAGVKFIKLYHRDPKFFTHPFTVKGWQSVEILVGTKGNGQKIYSYKISKDPNTGEDCQSDRNLVFEPKKPTNILEAQLPDTLYNRKKLASCYYYGAQWDIVDEIIDKDIKQMADELERKYEEDKKRQPTKDDIIVDLAQQKEKLEDQIAFLNAELKRKSETEKVVEEAKSKSDSKPKDDIKIDYEAIRIAEIRNAVKAEVHEEYKEAINKLKANNKNFWFTHEYKQNILPEINKRLSERLKNADNDSGVGDTNKK